MSLSTLALDAGWRDYAGAWNPLVEPLFAPLDGSSCHAPRLVMAPDVSHVVIPQGGKNSYNFNLVPGSLWWGLWALADVVNNDRQFDPPAPTIQLTDVGLGHKFFQEPVDPRLLAVEGSDTARYPSWFLLPTPHPVVGNGLFTLDVWGPPGKLYWIVVGIAEVKDCNS
jgi:hypothetical protein